MNVCDLFSQISNGKGIMHNEITDKSFYTKILINNFLTIFSFHETYNIKFEHTIEIHYFQFFFLENTILFYFMLRIYLTVPQKLFVI